MTHGNPLTASGSLCSVIFKVQGQTLEQTVKPGTSGNKYNDVLTWNEGFPLSWLLEKFSLLGWTGGEITGRCRIGAGCYGLFFFIPGGGKGSEKEAVE